MIAGIISQRSTDGDDCYKVQLPLPFEEACSLEKYKKLRALRDQASRIPDLQQWEIDAFIELCELKDLQQKNNSPKFSSSDCVWLDRGLAIIYEYSGFIDEYQRTARKLILLHTITTEYTVSTSTQSDSKQILLQLISTSVFFIGRAINIISNWRRLQSTPRLMLLLRNNDRDIDQNNQFNSAWHLITNVCSALFELIKINASEGGGAEVEQKIGFFLKYLSTELSGDEIALLLSPIMEYSQFSSLLRMERTFELCPPTQYSINNTEKSINEDEIFVTYNHTRKFLTMEKSFLDSYQGDRLLARAMIARLPTFRLPYNQPVSDLTDEVHLYDLESGNPFKWFPTTSTYAFYEQLGKNFRFSSSQATAESVHNSNIGSKPSEMQRNSYATKSVTDLRSTTKPLVLPILSPLGVRKGGSPSFSPVQNRHSFVSLEEEQTFGRRYTDSTEATGASDAETVGLRSTHNLKSSARTTTEVSTAVASPHSDRFIKSRTLLAPLETPSRRNSTPLETPSRRNSKSSESPTTTISQILSPIALGRQPNLALRDMAADLQKSKSAGNASFKSGLSQRSKMLESSLLLERRLLRAVEIISRWWLHYLPRKRLLHRLELRNLALSIIQEVTSTVYRIAVSRQKQRKHLLQYGCACKIQTLVRRFLSRRLRLSVRDGSSKSKKLRHQVKRQVLSKAEEKRRLFTAAQVIQRYVRGRITRRYITYWHKRRKALMSKLVIFMCTAVLKLRRWKIKRRNCAATVIQKYARGRLARNAMFKYVKAVIFLVTFWRRRMAYKAIRLRLRRIEKPCTIVVHSLRNMVQRKHIMSSEIRFRVSVWWHPLLHMVSENDFAVIIETRKPQFVYTSEPHDVTDDNKAADIMAGGCHIRRLPKEVVDPMAASNLPRSMSHRSRKTRPPMRQLRYMRVSAIQRKLDAAELGKLKQKQKQKKKKNSSGGNSQDDDDDDDDDDNEDEDDGANNVVQDEGNGVITKSAALSAFGLTRQRSMYSFIYHNIQDRIAARRETKAQEAAKNGSRSNMYKVRSPSILPSALLKIQKKKSIRSVGPHVETSVEKPGIESSNESPSADETSTTEQSNETAMIVRPSLQRSDEMVFTTGHALIEEENEDQEVDSDSDNDDEKDDDDEEGGTDAAGGNSALTLQQQQELLRIHSNHNMMKPVATRTGQASVRSRQGSLSPGIIAPRVSISAAGARSIDSQSRRPSSGGLLLNRASHMVRKSIKTFGSLAFSRASISSSSSSLESSKKMCDFKDEKVKIPGCHGNSVVQFEILEGEGQRKIGTSLFCMSQQNDLMFWGGEYRDEMKILKSKRVATMPIKGPSFPLEGKPEPPDELGPVLEFKITGGAARKSRCQWSRVMVLGKGPLRAIMRSREGIWQSLFENWERFYLSIDEDGLGLYENKFSLKPVHCIPLMDFKDLYCEMGSPVDLMAGDPTGSGKRVIEDFHTTILVTFSGDEIYMRFPDQNSVLLWQDSIDSAIQYCQKERTRVKRKRAVISLPRMSLYSPPPLSSSSPSLSSRYRHSIDSSSSSKMSLGSIFGQSKPALTGRRLSVGGGNSRAKTFSHRGGVGASSSSSPSSTLGNVVSIGRALVSLPSSSSSSLSSIAKKMMPSTTTTTTTAATLPPTRGHAEKEENEDDDGNGDKS